MYAKSAELVHMKSRSLARLAGSLLHVFSDESVELNDLLLDLLTSLLEKKPLLSPLFAESSSDKKRRRQVISKCHQNF